MIDDETKKRILFRAADERPLTETLKKRKNDINEPQSPIIKVNQT